MKRSIVIVLVTLTLCANNYCNAQTVNKYGDNLTTLDGIMKAYYDVVTVKKGGKISYERDSLMHLPNVKVGWVTRTVTGGKGFKLATLKEYHEHADPDLERDGFYEREISRKVDHFGSIYHVFSTYESRSTEKGPVFARGINSIELFYDGKRFWLLGWFFDAESKNNPLPAKYLPK